MRFEQLDLNLLVALDILMEEQNITRASEKLNLSQSATSSILSRLRAYFDDDILVQVGRKMQPTPYALDLQQPVRDVLSTIRSTIVSKRMEDPSQSTRHFRIIGSDYIIQTLMLDVLSEISAIAPNMTFEFLTPFSHGAELLAKGNADLLVVPEQVVTEGFSSAILADDEFVCACAQDNPLFDDSISAEQLTTTGFVTVGFDRHSKFNMGNWLNEEVRDNRKVEVIVNDFNTLSRALIGTQRVGLIPHKLAIQHAQHMPIKLLKLPFSFPKLREHLVWHPTLERDPIHRWLREKMLAKNQLDGAKA
jgi:LysR family transcriptional regulator, nod-box dependent transcriptional activator